MLPGWGAAAAVGRTGIAIRRQARPLKRKANPAPLAPALPNTQALVWLNATAKVNVVVVWVSL